MLLVLTSTLHLLYRERLAANMQHVTEHPEEVSKVKGLQRQVREVQTIMENNIQIVRPPCCAGGQRLLSWQAVCAEQQAQLRAACQRYRADPGRVSGRLLLQALARTERLEDLQARTDDLRASAGDFRRTNVALRRKMYWQNKKWWLIIIFLVIIVRPAAVLQLLWDAELWAPAVTWLCEPLMVRTAVQVLLVIFLSICFSGGNCFK